MICQFDRWKLDIAYVFMFTSSSKTCDWNYIKTLGYNVNVRLMFLALANTFLGQRLIMGQKHTLFFSASEGREEDLRWVLYQKKVSPNLRDHNTQEVALHLAASKGHAQCVKLLLKAGANVDARNNHGLTPLHLAVCDGKVSCVQALVDGGADVNATSRFGCTPLHQASYFDRLKCCQVLLQAGAWVDVQESWGRTPLFLAVEKRNSVMVTTLLRYNANVHITDQIQEQTCLVIASSSFDTDCMRLLLDHGSDPNHRDVSGLTPLHHVANNTIKNDIETCLRLLVAYGAMGCITNNDGVTALDVLLDKNKEEEAQILIMLTCKPRSLRSICWVQARKNLMKSRTQNLQELPRTVVHFIEDDLAFLDTS